jgi:hypothetical protein
VDNFIEKQNFELPMYEGEGEVKKNFKTKLPVTGC